MLYSQLEFTSPFHLRSDLYVDRPGGGGTRRLTRGARLSYPDARADGLIAAVQTIPGGTRLAFVARDGARVTPITSGGLDEHWSEPRWSPDGRHIAAVRWSRGGTSAVVVLDTAGVVVRTLLRERAVASAPSWSRDGRWVYFSSERSGLPNLYRAPFAPGDTGTSVVQRVSDARTGLFEPAPSPRDDEIAAVAFLADGYHVGIAPTTGAVVPDSAPAADVAPREPSPAPVSAAPSRRYSPWRSLLPRYLLPTLATSLDDNLTIGALTSGRDVVGRHSYEAQLFVPTDGTGLVGALFYRNASLGQPFIDLVTLQDWENFQRIFDASQQNVQVGILRRRIRETTVAFTLSRPRARSSAFLSLGGGVEVRDYATSPAPLIARIDSLYRRTFYYPQVRVALGWSNAQVPPNAISLEDGVSLASTTRFRWRTNDTTLGTLSVVGSATGYKSLDLPGYAHHVLALHVAGGAQDNRGTGYYEVGGLSSGTISILPGYVLGEGRRTFAVRGFPEASLLGIRAVVGSAEYRAPLLRPGRGLWILPLFLDRMSLTAFGDAGTAWCPGVFVVRPAPGTSLCTRSHVDNGLVFLEPKVIGSVGGELTASLAILSWDDPIRWRLGFAVPVVGTELVPGVRTATGYLTVGLPF